MTSAMKEKCAGTKSAREMIDLIIEASERHEGTEGEDSYWSCLFDAIVENVDVQPQVMEVMPMTDEEAKRFDQTRVPFGKHKGEKVSSVPLEYWLWLDEQPSFSRDLKRYLSSDLVQRRQGSMFDDGEFAG